jgi:hypothetical protein
MSFGNVARELRWVQPKWSRRNYELKAGEQTIARMEYRGKWRSTPFIILDDEELAIRSRNFWQSKFGVMRGEQEIALYQSGSLGKGDITFISGRRFSWRSKGAFSRIYAWVAPDNEEVMTFKSVSRFARSESIVTLSPSCDKYPETRILTAFGWFRMLAAAQAAAAAAT